MEMHPFEKRIVNSPLLNWLAGRFYYPRRLALVDPRLQGRVIELGCGAGWTTEVLLTHFPHCQMTAIDTDEEQVEAARRRFAQIGTPSQQILFLKGDATQLAFPDSSFDAAFEMHVFHHIKGYVKAIREAYRVLKPGGPFVAIDLGRRFFSPLISKFFPPEVTFTRGEFAGQMKQAGFQIQTEFGGDRSFVLIGLKPKTNAPA